jgi:hypothetical protein
MDTVLLLLAAVSFVAALGFGLVAWRALDEQRRRSTARVAALAGAIHATPDAAAPVAVSSLFDRESGAMMQGRPLIKGAVVGVLGVALIVFVTITTTRDGVEPQGAAAVTAAAADIAPLELMTMRHARNGEALTVTGLVRNPSSGSRVARITAVVLAFDRDGALVTTAQAPLDFTILAPGDESPFVVTVSNAAEVGRYRVSFRSEAGAIRHVDRRTASQLARAE